MWPQLYSPRDFGSWGMRCGSLLSFPAFACAECLLAMGSDLIPALTLALTGVQRHPRGPAEGGGGRRSQPASR